MKFLKADGTIEEGYELNEQDAVDFVEIKDLLHEHICRHSTHYTWNPEAKCLAIARRVAAGHESFRDVLFDVLNPKTELVSEPAPVPEPATVAATEDDQIF